MTKRMNPPSQMLRRTSKIEKLIEELCPEGVEWKTLGNAGRRNHGTNITAARMKDIHEINGPVRIFAGGRTVVDVPFNALPEKDIITDESIIVKSRGYIGFEFYNKPFSHKNELWSYTIKDNGVVQKFVYYYLITLTNILQNRARANSVKIPQLSVADTDNLKIPIPPLAIQQEIIKILDAFTTLEAELEAELEARKKQYEYYREELLTFGDDVEWKELGEVGKFLRGTAITVKETTDGKIPALSFAIKKILLTSLSPHLIFIRWWMKTGRSM